MCHQRVVVQILCSVFLGDGSGFGEILNQGSGRLETPTASAAVPPPTSGKFRRPLETMKEKEVHPKQVKVRAGRNRAGGVDGPLSAVTAVWARAS